MAGLSSRFTSAGYKLPKYMLPLHGRSVFAHAVSSFEGYFRSHPFLFIARDVAGTASFIETECRSIGVADARVAMLDRPTLGQAETVEQGLIHANVAADTALTIFNVDTFRPGFIFPDTPWWPTSDGYLEVFRGTGANWSYVRPDRSERGRVLETAEKQPISDLCCTGLYHFNRADAFATALVRERRNPSASELYVAPIYNHLIAAGALIHFQVIDTADVIFCGVPVEYEALKSEGTSHGR
jgi:hypothetical protein